MLWAEEVEHLFLKRKVQRLAHFHGGLGVLFGGRPMCGPHDRRNIHLCRGEAMPRPFRKAKGEFGDPRQCRERSPLRPSHGLSIGILKG